MATYSLGTVWDATQRALRTLIQVGIPAFLGFNLVLPQVIEAVGGVLPPDAILWLNAMALGITAVATALSRIMAIPAINNFLAKFRASTVEPSVAREYKVVK